MYMPPVTVQRRDSADQMKGGGARAVGLGRGVRGELPGLSSFESGARAKLAGMAPDLEARETGAAAAFRAKQGRFTVIIAPLFVC